MWVSLCEEKLFTFFCMLRYWLFGEKAQPDGIKKRERGWFPRLCAMELVEGVPHSEQDDKNK